MTDFDTQYLKPSALAEQWGFHRTTIYQWIRKGDLPHVRIGKSVRVPAAAWEEFLRRRDGGVTAGAAAVEDEDLVESEGSVRAEIEARLAAFKELSAGIDPFEYVARWKDGSIEDTAENAEIAIDALALRAVIERSQVSA